MYEFVLSSCCFARKSSKSSKSIIISNLIEYLKKKKNLRFLDLSNTKLSTFPDRTTNLCNLQTLNLYYTCIRKLPKGTSRMINLRHLGMYDCYNLANMPCGIRQSFMENQALLSHRCSTFCSCRYLTSSNGLCLKERFFLLTKIYTYLGVPN